MKSNIWMTSTFALGACLVLAGCSSDELKFEVKQGETSLKIVNAEEALAAADAAWTEALESSKEVYTTTDSSGCYMAPVQSETSLAAYCGPVSFLDGEENTWSAVNFAMTQGEGKEVTVEIHPGESGSTVSLMPGMAPDPKTLRNAQGESPTSDTPATPVPPAAASDALYYIPEGATVEAFEQPLKIIMPEGELAVTGQGIVEEVAVTTSEWNTSRRIAPEGKVLRTFQFNSEDSLDPSQWVVRVGEEAISLPSEGLYSGFTVVGAPDESILLEATSDGVTQVFDLNTQERVSTDVAQDWYATPTVTPQEREFAGEVQTPKGPARWAGGVKSVERTPWRVESGWADAGKSSWLIVNFEDAYWRSDASNYAVLPSGVPTATLVDAQGTTYPVETTGGSSFAGGQYMVFKVPADGTGYELTLESAGDFSDFAGASEPVSTSVKIVLNVAE